MAKIMEAMDIAQSRFPIYGARDDSEKTWKYFCGICWRMIRESEGDDA